MTDGRENLPRASSEALNHKSFDGERASLGKEGYFLRSLMENLSDRIYFKDLQSRFIFGNRSYAQLFNLENFSEIAGKTDFDFFSEFHARTAFEDEQEIIRTGQAKLNLEEMETWPDGRITWCSTSKAPLLDDQDRIIGTLGISRDITARKKAQEALVESEARYRQVSEELVSGNRRLMVVARSAEEARDGLAAALAEKEVLLREVHHRVKNSLQIVMSIISLHVRRTKDPVALATYNSILDRIRAISSVHNRLFDLDSEKRIDLPDYTKDLIRHFDENYGDAGAEFQFDAVPLLVPMDLCLDIGLVFTELIINAYSHAVIPAGGGPIQITLRREENTIVLTVADHGPGFPGGFAPSEVKTIGFGIILSMVNQRGGTLTIAPGPGAVVEVRLPLGPPEEKNPHFDNDVN
jgi:PAS domain S-box-containing protein